MDMGPKIAQVAALVGDPARANMLSALMDGRTLTATELAYVSGVAPQTASGHLAKLSDAGLLALEKQGRRRYFRLASPLVARMLEGLMVVHRKAPPGSAISGAAERRSDTRVRAMTTWPDGSPSRSPTGWSNARLFCSTRMADS